MFRRSSTSTTPTIPTAAASTNPDYSPARKQRSHSWASDPEPDADSRKPDPAGATRIRAKMARAVELATVLGNAKVDQALGLAATAGRLADDDLLSILGHIADSKPAA